MAGVVGFRSAANQVIGLPRESVSRVLRRMLACGQVTLRPSAVGLPSARGLLELTVQGIDAARAVDASQTEQAANPAVEPATEQVHAVQVAETVAVVPPPQADTAQRAPEVAAVVQAPCFDRIRAPAYMPERSPALRPGALDYKRLPTVGLRC